MLLSDKYPFLTEYFTRALSTNVRALPQSILFYGNDADAQFTFATEIARFFGMSERFIGLTIVAFGTSLPELVTSVTAARKGNAGIAIGNTAALICSVPFERKFIIDTIIAVLSGVLLWGGTIKKKELRKPCGILMLLGYAAYFVYLCVI